MEYKDWFTVVIIPSIISLTVIIVGLILEYRTGWFAQLVQHNEPSSDKTPLESDWGTAIITARQTLAKMHSVKIEAINVQRWHKIAFGKKAKLTIETLPFEKHTVIINKKGHILEEDQRNLI